MQFGLSTIYAKYFQNNRLTNQISCATIFIRKGGEGMTIGDRIREIRNDINMSRREFGEIFGVSGDVINNIESNRLKRPDQKESLYKLICKELGINIDWLIYGIGDKTNKLPTDEVGDIVSGIIEDKNNRFYQLIIEAMKSYYELDEASKIVISNYLSDLVARLKKREEEG